MCACQLWRTHQQGQGLCMTRVSAAAGEVVCVRLPPPNTRRGARRQGSGDYAGKGATRDEICRADSRRADPHRVGGLGQLAARTFARPGARYLRRACSTCAPTNSPETRRRAMRRRRNSDAQAVLARRRRARRRRLRRGADRRRRRRNSRRLAAPRQPAGDARRSARRRRPAAVFRRQVGRAAGRDRATVSTASPRCAR